MTSPRPPTPHGPHSRPIARFLGAAEASGGPFALLGMSPQACTDELVLSGLDRQVDRVNRHPECDTPEADEVRLALHAAAAQLLDPVVRRHLISRWGGTPRPAAPTPKPESARRAAPVHPLDAQRLLEADAILTLGLYGGWNQRALRRLVSLAHRRGLTSLQVAQTLRTLSRRRGRTRPDTPRPVQARRPTSRLQVRLPQQAMAEVTQPQRDPAQRLLRNAIIFGFLGFIGLTAAVIGIILATGQRPSPAVPPPPPIASAPTGADDNLPPEPTETPGPAGARRPVPPPPAPGDLAAVQREIGACTEALAIDPGAAVLRFEQAIGTLAAHWTAMPRDRLISAHDAIVEFLYRCGASPDIALRAVGAIARYSGSLGAGGDSSVADVVPATWSVGMLTRLGREKDLTATSRNAIDSALGIVLGQASAALDQSFEAGAASAINAWPQKLTPTGAGAKTTPVSREAWLSWAQCVDALAGTDAKARVRFLVNGLETVLAQGPESNENRSVGVVITDLTTRITWRQEDDSRRWLLRWFADPRISTSDLNCITSALATRSGAEGIDLTMVLSTSASENTRAELRERFATVWGVHDSLARDEQIADWAKIAREAINTSFTSLSEADDMAAAVVLARLNDAAWWQWRGDSTEAMRLISDIKGPVEQAMAMPPGVKGGGANDEPHTDLTDGAWAERYLAARNTPKIRRDLIEQIMAGTGIGSTDAEVLIGEAFTGSPQDIRTIAQEAVKKFAETGPVLGALLERLPRAPRTAGVAELIGVIAAKPLPGFRDPDWPIAARRAIVERLLEALAAESPRVRIDRLSAVLSASYRSMASPAPIPPDQRAVRIQPAAHHSAAELWRKWRSAADPLVPSSPPPIPLDHLERRRLGRLSQARGMVQAFAAEQTSVAEAMSYIVACEQPVQTEQVRLVLTSMASDRRHATSVLEQIKITERAITQLWLIRMQQEPAS